MEIIVGLGNPGEKYKLTRHNAGFMAIDALGEKLEAAWRENKRLKCLMAKIGETILVKPMTYMNLSGEAVEAVMSYYKRLPKKLGVLKIKDSDLTGILTIIHDDIDVDLGKYKIATDSGSAGHNGVRSIIDRLKTKNFRRVRIGVRSPLRANMPADKFVLDKFSGPELDTIKNLIPQIIKEIKK